MGGTHNTPEKPFLEPLTRRERDVLSLLAEGLTAPEISGRLVLGLSTVKYHLQHLYEKLGVNSKRQAVARGHALGLLAAPALAAVPEAAPRHNLPHAATRFFGREAELAAVTERLAEHRLVTLAGAGGVGKTRLALRVAETVFDGYAYGAWLVELAAISDPDLVAQQVASAVGAREEPGHAIVDTLAAFLRPRQALLVLDNCEHLLEACAQLTDRLLRACPELSLLATSREPLGVAGEAIFTVPSLTVPEAAQADSLEAVGRSPAVRLFLDRARLVRPDYQLTPRNMGWLAQICRRLDGIPLALEMAAARINLLSAEQLAARLDESLRFLTGNNRAALPKHQTLRATLDWSYQLLNEEERCLLRRLSVFAGGCTLEAAEAVCASYDLAASAVLDRLTSLVAKSLVMADRRQGEAARYWLLEMTRQFCNEQLAAAGELLALRVRQRNYILAFAETYLPQYTFNERAKWAKKLVPERDNLRLALQFSFGEQADSEPSDAGPRLALAAARFGFSYQEQTEWSTRAVAWCQSHPDISPGLIARLQQAFAFTVGMDDRQTPLIWAQQAVAIHRSLGPAGHRSLLAALNHLASVYIQEFADPERGSETLLEGEALFQSFQPGEFTSRQHWRQEAYFQSEWARIAILHGDYQTAKAKCAESLRLRRLALEDDVFVVYMSLGEACYFLGEYDEATTHFLAALHSTDENDPLYQRTSYALRWLGRTWLAQGDLLQAANYCTASIREAGKVPDRNMIASDLGIAAAIAARHGYPLRAAQLAGASHALYARQGRTPWEDSSLDTLLPGWQLRPDHAALTAAYQAGQALTAEEAVAYALAGLAV